MITGILAPMPEEIDLILAALTNARFKESGQRKFISGEIEGKNVVVALSRVGKVAAAVTAAVMIEQFEVDQIILTGVAGAISSQVSTGDIVVANSSVQHDLDARPLFRRFEAPILGRAFFDCDPTLIELAARAAKNLLQFELNNHIDQDHIKQFALERAQVHLGLICCGDQFIGSQAQLDQLKSALPHALCVEMESGAVGQVCYEYGVPYVAIRSISDSANHNAHIDFAEYIQTVSRHYTLAMVKGILAEM